MTRRASRIVGVVHRGNLSIGRITILSGPVPKVANRQCKRRARAIGVADVPLPESGALFEAAKNPS
jgi:hypothetical protein